MSTKEAGEQILADLTGSAYLEQKAAQRNSFNEVLQDAKLRSALAVLRSTTRATRRSAAAIVR